MLNEIDLSRVDLNLLVLFEAVLAERHVGRSAERLNLSPSAISHGLGRLRRLLNDPLFLRTPRGVVPTDRAMELAAPVGEILGRVRAVLAVAEPFDPTRSRRRFTVGAPDGVSAVVLPVLLASLRAEAPDVAVSLSQILPVQGDVSPERAWREALAALEARTLDIAILPSDAVPARFAGTRLYEEDFVIALRRGHPYAEDPTLDRYCAMRHLVVSATGDPFGFVDQVLARHGRARHTVSTAPNFLLALALIAETDLVAALPRRFVAAHAARFGVDGVEAPVPLGRFPINAVVPRAAMTDRGLAWLLDRLTSTGCAPS
ncbi:LysR family transcriptional regulator [Methylobacterium oxalidis]|uniref:LysR family transcriptional regulator n=1 Tax=Methylobacterium oxalidis TaxID=944322 RepID=UPI0033147F38